MLSRHTGTLILALSLAGLACSSGTDYGTGGGGGTPLVADVKIVVGASTKGANAFSPNPYTVALSGGPSVSVKWGNGDQRTSHSIVANGAGPLFSSPTLAPGATFTFTFTAAGTYEYHCGIHGSMTGSIVVNP